MLTPTSLEASRSRSKMIFFVKGAASRIEDLPYSWFHYRPNRRPLRTTKVGKMLKPCKAFS